MSEAGRELDERIAREVMGLDVRPITLIDHRGATTQPGTVSEPYRMSDGRMGRAATEIPHYSTDIASAFLVVEKMVAGGFEVGIMCCPTSPTHFDCEMAKPAWRGSEVEDAETLPLAICLAALAAISSSQHDGGERE